MKKLFISTIVIVSSCFGCGSGGGGGGYDSGNTTLKVQNSSDEDITVWLTLGNIPGYVTSVNGIFGIATIGLQGSFILKAGETAEYTSEEPISGNISFGTAPENCPTSEYPNGINIFEFCLNNYGQEDNAQETIDVSNVAGISSIIKVTLSGGGAWNAGSDNPNITTFQNDELYKNTGLIGVFPYGCDNCTSSDNPPVCLGHPAYETPQALPICNVQRNADSNGGIITVEFVGSL